jgi:hypothetical protein
VFCTVLIYHAYNNCYPHLFFVLAQEQASAAGVKNEIYLLVDSRNTPAQSLYKKQGYKLEFVDEAATCVVSGPYNLRTEDCVNYCFKKTLSGARVAGGSNSGGGSNPFGSLFGSLFGKK